MALTFQRVAQKLQEFDPWNGKDKQSLENNKRLIQFINGDGEDEIAKLLKKFFKDGSDSLQFRNIIEVRLNKKDLNLSDNEVEILEKIELSPMFVKYFSGLSKEAGDAFEDIKDVQGFVKIKAPKAEGQGDEIKEFKSLKIPDFNGFVFGGIGFTWDQFPRNHSVPPRQGESLNISDIRFLRVATPDKKQLPKININTSTKAMEVLEKLYLTKAALNLAASANHTNSLNSISRCYGYTFKTLDGQDSIKSGYRAQGEGDPLNLHSSIIKSSGEVEGFIKDIDKNIEDVERSLRNAGISIEQLKNIHINKDTIVSCINGGSKNLFKPKTEQLEASQANKLNDYYDILKRTYSNFEIIAGKVNMPMPAGLTPTDIDEAAFNKDKMQICLSSLYAIVDPDEKNLLTEDLSGDIEGVNKADIQKLRDLYKKLGVIYTPLYDDYQILAKKGKAYTNSIARATDMLEDINKTTGQVDDLLLAGGPGTGKTETIKALKDKGYEILLTLQASKVEHLEAHTKAIKDNASAKDGNKRKLILSIDEIDHLRVEAIARKNAGDPSFLEAFEGLEKTAKDNNIPIIYSSGSMLFKTINQKIKDLSEKLPNNDTKSKIKELYDNLLNDVHTLIYDIDNMPEKKEGSIERLKEIDQEVKTVAKTLLKYYNELSQKDKNKHCAGNILELLNSYDIRLSTYIKDRKLIDGNIVIGNLAAITDAHVIEEDNDITIEGQENATSEEDKKIVEEERTVIKAIKWSVARQKKGEKLTTLIYNPVATAASMKDDQVPYLIRSIPQSVIDEVGNPLYVSFQNLNPLTSITDTKTYKVTWNNQTKKPNAELVTNVNFLGKRTVIVCDCVRTPTEWDRFDPIKFGINIHDSDVNQTRNRGRKKNGTETEIVFTSKEEKQQSLTRFQVRQSLEGMETKYVTVNEGRAEVDYIAKPSEERTFDHESPVIEHQPTKKQPLIINIPVTIKKTKEDKDDNNPQNVTRKTTRKILIKREPPYVAPSTRPPLPSTTFADGSSSFSSQTKTTITTYDSRYILPKLSDYGLPNASGKLNAMYPEINNVNSREELLELKDKYDQLKSYWGQEIDLTQSYEQTRNYDPRNPEQVLQYNFARIANVIKYKQYEIENRDKKNGIGRGSQYPTGSLGGSSYNNDNGYSPYGGGQPWPHNNDNHYGNKSNLLQRNNEKTATPVPQRPGTTGYENTSYQNRNNKKPIINQEQQKQLEVSKSVYLNSCFDYIKSVVNDPDATINILNKICLLLGISTKSLSIKIEVQDKIGAATEMIEKINTLDSRERLSPEEQKYLIQLADSFVELNEPFKGINNRQLGTEDSYKHFIDSKHRYQAEMQKLSGAREEEHHPRPLIHQRRITTGPFISYTASTTAGDGGHYSREQ